MPHKRITLRSGQRFGRLAVVREHPERTPAKKSQWVCRCDCGQIAVVVGSKLLSGRTQSCGCLKLELMVARGGLVATKHGLARSPEYRAWIAMKNRCQDTQNARYGGRGITVCERWRTFENFYADMGPRPTPAYSLDRINNDGPYTPENCRWATQIQQARNVRTNLRLTHDGETLTLAEWSERCGINATTLLARINQGWLIDRVLTVPTRPHRRYPA